MDKKWKIAAGLAVTLTSAAFALSFQHTVTGRIDNFAFPSGNGGRLRSGSVADS
jgi:hypothetical protein